MKIKQFIEAINSKMSEKFRNYKITTEFKYDVLKLDYKKNVTRYSTILESDVSNFHPNFTYYLERSPDVYLYAHYKNRLGNIDKINLGVLKILSNSNQYVFLHLTNRKYKMLNRAIKKALDEKPKKGKCSYNVTIKFDIGFDTECLKRHFIPKKVEYYLYTFSDNTTKELPKEYAYVASDYVINKKVSINTINMYTKYIFEPPPFEQNVLS